MHVEGLGIQFNQPASADLFLSPLNFQQYQHSLIFNFNIIPVFGITSGIEKYIHIYNVCPEFTY